MFTTSQTNQPQPRLHIRQVEAGSTSSNSLEGFKKPLPPSSIRKSQTSKMGLEEALFDNKAKLKVLTSRVAVYLDKLQRSDLFNQVDSLLDSECWAEDSEFVQESSFYTLLRFITWKPKVLRIGLSVSSRGNIMGSWFSCDNGNLTIEFRENDNVLLVASKAEGDKGTQTLAFTGNLKNVDKVLESFDAVKWYRETT